MSHVLPYPPRAGNEFRINRMLAWMMANGHEVTVLVCPLPDATVRTEDIAAAAEVFSSVAVLERAGVLWHNFPADSPVLSRSVRCRVASDVEVNRVGEPSAISDFEQYFCPDCLVDTVGHLDAALSFDVVLTVYAFMAGTYASIHRNVLKLVDTQDVLSSRSEKVVQFGISDMHLMDAADEARLLSKSDVIIGIQPEESEELARLVPGKTVITVGVDVPVPPNPLPVAVDPIAMLVASYNPMNNKGLLDFLRFAWPLIRRDVPTARLQVVGDVGRAATWTPRGVDILGRVDDLATVYERAAVVINPAVAGTGLKVKTVEAFAHLRPVVTFPAGIEGMDPSVHVLADVVKNWFEFAMQVIERLKHRHAAPDAHTLAELRRALSPDTTYAPLAAVLDGR